MVELCNNIVRRKCHKPNQVRVRVLALLLPASCAQISPLPVLMLARNARLHLQRLQKVRLSPKRRTLATALNATKSNDLHFFDHPPHRPSWSRSPTGLFGQPSLVSPSSFQNLALATLIRAQLLTERIVRARQSRDELFKVVKNLDRLSDMLCSVIDLAELVRNAHPDPEWVKSANEAYEQLCEYMNVLNTNVGLYEVRLLFPLALEPK